MTDQPSPPPYPHDPESPYFETLFMVARKFDPAVTREQALAMIREADPDDTLHIGEPYDPDGD